MTVLDLSCTHSSPDKLGCHRQRLQLFESRLGEEPLRQPQEEVWLGGIGRRQKVRLRREAAQGAADSFEKEKAFGEGRGGEVILFG